MRIFSEKLGIPNYMPTNSSAGLHYNFMFMAEIHHQPPPFIRQSVESVCEVVSHAHLFVTGNRLYEYLTTYAILCLHKVADGIPGVQEVLRLHC
ncbi:hypothetical protein TNCV_3256451 [Trichonephila clavipes]|nr:hypothetical protein TNCV_3256451 [Trichonephila clavipes]